jgi:hypothetical protein
MLKDFTKAKKISRKSVFKAKAGASNRRQANSSNRHCRACCRFPCNFQKPNVFEHIGAITTLRLFKQAKRPRLKPAGKAAPAEASRAENAGRDVASSGFSFWAQASVFY